MPRRLRAALRRLRFEGPGWLASWALRPRAAGVDADVVRETWDVVADGAHNSNTDVIMLRPSHIRKARIDLAALEALGERSRA